MTVGRALMEVNSIWQDDPIPLQVLGTDRYNVVFPLIAFKVEISAHIFLPLPVSDRTARVNFYQPLLVRLFPCGQS